MNTPVDVLAVLDDHIRVHGRNHCPNHARELVEVRHIVAELIAASQRVIASDDAHDSPYAIDDIARMVKYEHAFAGLRAALANIGSTL
ncbi:MAG TPA: hypothetical protein VN731_10265 [Rhodanobacter sp.]|nr:hypothetical protein [Rhodanobacter sp.]